jgi:hypothetical protein
VKNPICCKSESAQIIPEYEWTANNVDLLEILVGIYQTDVVRLRDGSCPDFTPFAESILSHFGITFANLSKEANRVIVRKRSQTPFLLRIIECLKNKRIKMDR